MSHWSVSKFIQVAETFGKFEINSNLAISQTALFMLAAPSVDDETRAVALEMAAAGDLKTTADYNGAIHKDIPRVL